MRILFAIAITLFVSVNHASAWNNKGHMVVARLAWLELTPAARQAAVAILSHHPHVDNFLRSHRPSNIPEDEWMFLRAATWPDFVRGFEASTYHHGTWHYKDIAFVPPGSHANPADLHVDAENLVTQLPDCMSKVESSSDAAEKAVCLCWVLHLIGDVHQPLHCTALLSEEFDEGDHGGNYAIVRLGNSTKNLHEIWDGLLGRQTSLSSIGGTVAEVQDLDQQNSTAINADLLAHTTAQAWCQEGFETAKQHAYLNGSLNVANSEEDPEWNDIPHLPNSYLENAGRVARLCAARAGHRLATAVTDIAQ